MHGARHVPHRTIGSRIEQSRAYRVSSDIAGVFWIDALGSENHARFA
jgi:hypothetical protein